MENKLKVLFLIILIITSCNNKKQEKRNINDILIISLEYILDHEKLPQEYLKQPLQVIQNNQNKILTPLRVNGKNCIILPEKTDVYKIISNMNLFKPIPIVEIIDIKFLKDFVTVDIIFRSTGHAFELKLKNKEGSFEVVNMKTTTI